MGSISREAVSKRFIEAFNKIVVDKHDLRGQQFMVVAQSLAFIDGEDVVKMVATIQSIADKSEYEVVLADDGTYFDPEGSLEDEIERVSDALAMTEESVTELFKKVRP